MSLAQSQDDSAAHGGFVALGESGRIRISLGQPRDQSVFSHGTLGGASCSTPAVCRRLRIKQVLTNWIVGPLTVIGDREARIVQGRKASGTPIKLYFDEETGLLVRLVRYSTQSPVGRVPTQVDFEDYRDVSGIKFPFKWTSTWTNGRTVHQLKSVQINPPIPATTFERPMPPARPAAR
jgi:hypothetical protein